MLCFQGNLLFFQRNVSRFAFQIALMYYRRWLEKRELDNAWGKVFQFK